MEIYEQFLKKLQPEVSFRMLVTLWSGLALWVIYGVTSKSLPIIAANVAGFMLIEALVGMKLRFDANPLKD
jgi:uncharacterized protein with PQ loop repeat